MNVYLEFFNFGICTSSLLSLCTEQDMGQILEYKHMYFFWDITWLKEASINAFAFPLFSSLILTLQLSSPSFSFSSSRIAVGLLCQWLEENDGTARVALLGLVFMMGLLKDLKLSSAIQLSVGGSSNSNGMLQTVLSNYYSKTKSTTVSGAVLWTTAIKLFLKLSHHQEVDPLIIFNLYVQLWILYQHDSKHTPKTGIYLHDLAVHAASQYQIVCLCSVNVESQECLFSQIKQTSLRKTNRKPENVLTTILLSLQAEKKVGVGNAAMKGQESMVAMVAKKVPRHNGTSMDKSFVKTGSTVGKLT